MEIKKFKFKTNINCAGCIAAVRPKLNELDGLENWTVDTENPDKILTVSLNTAKQEDVINAVKSVGYKIEAID
ncbi:MAG: cation transporter [Bacteroidales bacterium]|jgi:copper chaperone|nr:cation transporter [Bacteroidales bacterium]MCK9499583.1 cation transporter [Bacteroidales bacterium]MDY0315536.1 cation transporter [Bacteroidales bacterium]